MPPQCLGEFNPPQKPRVAPGHVRIDRLTPEMVDELLAAKAAAGLSRSYVSRTRTILADPLRHADRRGAVVRNAGAPALCLGPSRRPLGGLSRPNRRGGCWKPPRTNTWTPSCSWASHAAYARAS
jgi:hypothetical protein